MPHVNGSITEHGAVLAVLVGLSSVRRDLLIKHNFPVASPIPVRALLDTGSAISGFTPAVFEQLDLTPIGEQTIRTPSTLPGRPGVCDVFDVHLVLVSGTDQTAFRIRALACEDFDRDRDGDVHGIIGRDVLNRCTLFYVGGEQRFELAWI